MGRAIQFVALALNFAGVCLAGQPIGILFDFGTRPDSAIVDRMKSEIRQILAPAQLNLALERVGETGADQAFSKIVIVRFHGACQTRVDSGGIQLDNPDRLDNPALGRTDISGGQVLPYVQVYCNEVRAFLPSVSRLPFAQIYGRALGRVVAHELYHALLSTRNHTRTGLARVSQTARDLTRGQLLLDLGSISRLHDLYSADLYSAPQKKGGSGEPPLSEGKSNVLLENQP